MSTATHVVVTQYRETGERVSEHVHPSRRKALGMEPDQTYHLVPKRVCDIAVVAVAPEHLLQAEGWELVRLAQARNPAGFTTILPRVERVWLECRAGRTARSPHRQALAAARERARELDDRPLAYIDAVALAAAHAEMRVWLPTPEAQAAAHAVVNAYLLVAQRAVVAPTSQPE